MGPNQIVPVTCALRSLHQVGEDRFLTPPAISPITDSICPAVFVSLRDIHGWYILERRLHNLCIEFAMFQFLVGLACIVMMGRDFTIRRYVV